MTNKNYQAQETAAIMLATLEAITNSNEHQERQEPETFHLNSGLLPCIEVGMYESPLSPNHFEEQQNELEREDGNEFNYVILSWDDWKKELAKKANDWLQENVIDVLRNYGVISIEGTDIWSPKYYNYRSDELNMTVKMADGWRDIMAEKVAGWRGRKDVEKYIESHWHSYSGFISFMPYSLDEILTESDEERQLAAYLTIALLTEDALDETEDGSRSLYELSEIMDSDFSDYELVNVIGEYFTDELEADRLEALWNDTDKWNELYWDLRERIGAPWLHDKESQRLSGKKDAFVDFHADSDGKRLLFWACQHEHTVSDLYNMAA